MSAITPLGLATAVAPLRGGARNCRPVRDAEAIRLTRLRGLHALLTAPIPFTVAEAADVLGIDRRTASAWAAELKRIERDHDDVIG